MGHSAEPAQPVLAESTDRDGFRIIVMTNGASTTRTIGTKCPPAALDRNAAAATNPQPCVSQVRAERPSY